MTILTQLLTVLFVQLQPPNAISDYPNTSNGYIVDNHTNCSSVMALMPSYIKLLGKLNSTNECINECLSYSSNQCTSYTYYLNNSECWIYYDNPIWLPYPIKNINCGRIIYSCKSDSDCSYNGKCNNSTGICSCTNGWNGYKCDNLILLPANKSSGYNYLNKNISSWGGAIAYNPNNEKYIMFVTELANNCGIDSWLNNCQMVYAESEKNNWNSKYIKISQFMEPFSCTPDMITLSNEYVLLYTENTPNSNKNPIPCNCTDGSTPSTCNKNRDYIELTSVRYIQNLSNGDNLNNWSSNMIIDTIPSGDSNFAALINDDNSLIGMIRTSDIALYLVTASNWKDNSTYKMNETNGYIFPYLSHDGTEDMYLYKDCNNIYHALFHNRDPNGVQTLCGSHAYSSDGYNWIYTGLAYNNYVKFTDGTDFTFLRRERPHLIFDINDGCTPVALTNSAETGGVNGDAAYTLVQPIQQ